MQLQYHNGDVLKITYFKGNKELCKCVGIVEKDVFHVLKGSIPLTLEQVRKEVVFVSPDYIEEVLAELTR